MKRSAKEIGLLYFILVVGIVLLIMFLPSTARNCIAEPIQLSFGGIHPKMDMDEKGNMYLICFPDYDDRQIMLYDPQTGFYEKVPGSENRFPWSWDIMYAGIGAGYKLVAIAWCVDNTDIWYVERDLVNDQWIEYHSIYHGVGVNRTDIDIGPDGTMILIQKEGQTFSMWKPHGGNFTEIPLFYQTGDPRVEYVNGNFYGTINTGTLQKFAKFSNGSWQIISFFNTDPGYPDAAGFFVDHNENIYASSLLWLGSTNDYRQVYVGHFEGNNQKIEVIYQGHLDDDNSRPPANSLAVDNSGNIVACFGNGIQKKSYCRTKRNGYWENLEEKGDSNFIVIDYFHPYFHLIYNRNGSFWYDKFTFETIIPTPTPTWTPTETFSPTETPHTPTPTPSEVWTPIGTKTPTPTPIMTPVPTDTPGVCPTPVCWWQWWGYGIGCRW